MKHTCTVCFALAVLLLTLHSSPVIASAPAAQQPLNWASVHSTGSGVDAELQIQSFAVESDELGSYIEIPGALPSESQIPTVPTMITAPNGAGVEANIEAGDFVSTGLFAEELAGTEPGVTVGDPVVFRGIRLFPLSIRPARVTEDGEIQLAQSTTLTVDFTGSDDRAEGDGGTIAVTADVERFINGMVLNLDDIDLSVVAPVGRLLVVVEDNAVLEARIEPYVQWKRQQGYEVIVDHPTNTGSTTSIFNLISGYYNDDSELPLDHVLLIGDDDGDVDMAAYSNLTDHWYAQLEGDDILADVSIGRFSVRNANDQLNRAVSKVIAYERDVHLDDTTWLENAALTSGSGSGTSTILTNRSIRWMLGTHDISSDTLWWTMGYPGGIPQFIVDQTNAGVTWINYRGWLGMSGWNSGYLDQMTNDSRLPVVVTITCGTGDFATQVECISEGFFRAGSGNTLAGAVASIGTATMGTHTRFNNIVDAGVFEAPALSNIRSLGWALMNGKLRLYEAFVNTGDAGNITNFSNWNNLIGDPALRLWTGVPQDASVEHETTLPAGRNYLDVDVEFPGEWPELVWVTLSRTDRVVDTRRIDQSGHTRLTWNAEQVTGSMTLTVVGDNVVPYQAEIISAQQPQYVVVSATSISDGPGDDEMANPGETVALNFTMRNAGADPSPARTATVSTDSPYLTVVGDPTFEVPALNPGQTQLIESAVAVEVTSWAPDGAEPELTVTVGENQTSDARISVFGWVADTGSLVATFDGDGVLEPEETAQMTLPWSNAGSTPASNLTGTVTTGAPGVIIEDAVSDYGWVPVGGVATNASNPFTVTTTDQVYPGQRVDFILAVEDGDGAVDSVAYPVYLGDPAGSGLTGPDGYGYWAIDDGDSGLGMEVTYNWTDIAQAENDLGINDTSNEDDEAVTVELPFPFAYYGQIFTRITISSNGTASFGNTADLYTFRNWPIPNPLGPPAMLAVNWDDMLTSGGGVYAWHDQQTGRYIIQWNVQTRYNGASQDFQAILYNPQFWPTATGNGMIKFQYQEFSQQSGYYYDNDYCTVGIETPDQQDGIEYVYWTQYANGASSIGDQAAILFTDDLSGGLVDPDATITPDEFTVVYAGAPVTETIQIGNTGTGPLLWSIDTIGGEFIGAQRRLALGLPLVPSPRPVDQAETPALTGEQSDARKRVEERTARAGERDGEGGVRDSGGPDDFGYTWVDSNEPDGPEYAWHADYGDALDQNDIVSGDYDDGYFSGQTLPFSFEFYGVDYNAVHINTNGFITFDAGREGLDTYANIPLPSLDAPHDGAPATMIAAFWDDLNPGEGGSIHFYSDGSDLAVITWNGIRGWGPRGGPYTFQILLHSDGKIFCQYQEMGAERLDECTIGVQNEDGTIGLTVADDAPYMEDELAIRFSIPTIWLSAIDVSGLVPEGESEDAEILIDGEGMPDGVFDATVVVSTNDQDLPEFEIPVTLYVGDDNIPPQVGDIPDQVIEAGGAFATIDLDDYVEDPQFPDEQIVWSASGENELDVSIVNRVATITPPAPDWTGSETVTFTATNPNDISDSDDATFTVALESFDVPLQAGRFELVSFPVTMQSLAVEDVFASIAGLVVVQDDAGGVYRPQTGYNTIGDVDLTEGYRLLATESQTFSITGNPIDAMTEYTVLADQWNWVGHPYVEPMPVDVACEELGEQLQIVVDDEGRFWWPELGINTIGELVPGVGYRVHVREDATFSYVWPVSTTTAGVGQGEITTLPEPPRAPEPTGEPFLVRVRLHQQLLRQGAGTVELYDGRTLAGAGAVIPERGEAVVVAWQADPGAGLAGFEPGAPIDLRVLDASGADLNARLEGETAVFGEGAFTTVSAQPSAVPAEFAVHAGYPNPFNPALTVPFDLPVSGEVTFAVYNVLGRRVLHEVRRADAGRHTFVFKPDRGATSGVYFLEVRFRNHIDRQKVVLLK